MQALQIWFVGTNEGFITQRVHKIGDKEHTIGAQICAPLSNLYIVDLLICIGPQAQTTQCEESIHLGKRQCMCPSVHARADQDLALYRDPHATRLVVFCIMQFLGLGHGWHGHAICKSGSMCSGVAWSQTCHTKQEPRCWLACEHRCKLAQALRGSERHSTDTVYSVMETICKKHVACSVWHSCLCKYARWMSAARVNFHTSKQPPPHRAVHHTPPLIHFTGMGSQHQFCITRLSDIVHSYQRFGDAKIT